MVDSYYGNALDTIRYDSVRFDKSTVTSWNKNFKSILVYNFGFSHFFLELDHIIY